MSEHDFQLTYSIPDTLDGSSAIARDKMRGHHRWNTVDDIDTTLIGKLPLQGLVSEKRDQAKKEVKRAIQELLKQSRRDKPLALHASLMVSGLGEHICFNVSV